METNYKNKEPLVKGLPLTPAAVETVADLIVALSADHGLETDREEIKQTLAESIEGGASLTGDNSAVVAEILSFLFKAEEQLSPEA